LAEFVFILKISHDEFTQEVLGNSSVIVDDLQQKAFIMLN